MPDSNRHRAAVNAWAERAASGLPPEQVLAAFEEALGALWRRAHLTLGEVTLTAILDRVLHDAASQFPELSAAKAGPGGLQCDELRAQASSLDPARLLDALKLVLVELLTVLGNLVAEILTPGLHAELAKMASSERRPPAPRVEEANS